MPARGRRRVTGLYAIDLPPTLWSAFRDLRAAAGVRGACRVPRAADAKNGYMATRRVDQKSCRLHVRTLAALERLNYLAPGVRAISSCSHPTCLVHISIVTAEDIVVPLAKATPHPALPYLSPTADLAAYMAAAEAHALGLETEADVMCRQARAYFEARRGPAVDAAPRAPEDTPVSALLAEEAQASDAGGHVRLTLSVPAMFKQQLLEWGRKFYEGEPNLSHLVRRVLAERLEADGFGAEPGLAAKRRKVAALLAATPTAPIEIPKQEFFVELAQEALPVPEVEPAQAGPQLVYPNGVRVPPPEYRPAPQVPVRSIDGALPLPELPPLDVPSSERAMWLTGYQVPASPPTVDTED